MEGGEDYFLKRNECINYVVVRRQSIFWQKNGDQECWKRTGFKWWWKYNV